MGFTAEASEFFWFWKLRGLSVEALYAFERPTIDDNAYDSSQSYQLRGALLCYSDRRASLGTRMNRAMSDTNQRILL
ncbi:MAG: hypothetical protein N2170_08800 [Bacteroidia bacterium]|nr:hypothetical protein [Bacteroidia bacterium]